MVRKIEYVLIDDIDGSEAVETVRFCVGGRHYEMELNETHLAEFNRSMDRWVSRARRVQAPKGEGARAGVKPVRNTDGAKIRRWAAENGIQVAARGRIPASLRQRYYAESVDSA